MADDPQPGPEDEVPHGDGGDHGAAGGPGSGAGGFPGIPGFDPSQIDLGQLMRMLSSEGPVNWEVARQVAAGVATGDEPEARIDPADREEHEDLARAAETLVVAESGLEETLGLPVLTLGRREWAERQLEALRPVLEALALTLRRTLDELDLGEADLDDIAAQPGSPFASLGIHGVGDIGNMLGMLAPMLLGVQSGSMVGYLAQHALGRYDLPLPTTDRPAIWFVAPNLGAFEQAWSIERRDLRFYLALHETARAGIRTVPWVQARLARLTTEFVSGYSVDPRAIEEHFGALDPNDPSSLAAVTDHPEELLGAIRTDRQRDLLAEVQTLTMALEGYADVVLERVGTRLLPEFARIHEAIARHHVERGEAERFIEGLLGVGLGREHYERGAAFCRGVVERAGMDGLNRLWAGESRLPTPAELDAPGLWLARIELPDDAGDHAG